MGGPEPAEWSAALSGLREPVSHLRAEALDALSSQLAACGWSLPAELEVGFAHALKDRINDSNWSVCQKALAVVGELVARGDGRFDQLAASQLIPPLLAKARARAA